MICCIKNCLNIQYSFMQFFLYFLSMILEAVSIKFIEFMVDLAVLKPNLFSDKFLLQRKCLTSLNLFFDYFLNFYRTHRTIGERIIEEFMILSGKINPCHFKIVGWFLPLLNCFNDIIKYAMCSCYCC